jgi:hypothetical protein
MNFLACYNRLSFPLWMSCVLLCLQFQQHTVLANILSRLPQCGTDQCHCTDATECPALPSIDSDVVDQLRTLQHGNPLTIQCDPFASTSCVKDLTDGEACVVELILPTEGGTCPADWSYQ